MTDPNVTDGTQGNGAGDPGAGAGGGSPDTPQSKTFTQADIDRIVADRLAREKAKYEGYDDLKKKAEQFDKTEREKLSEIERLKLEKTDLEKAAKEAEARIAEAQKAAETQMVYNAVLAQVSEFKIKVGNEELSFRRDATSAVLKLVDLSKVEIKNGEIAGIDKALESLAKESPFLLEKPRQPGSSPANPAKTTHGRSDEEMRQRLFGTGQKGNTFFEGGGLIKLPE